MSQHIGGIVRAYRGIVLLMAIAISVFAGPAAASANYPPTDPAGSVSDTVVSTGGVFTFFGEGFTPGETVNVTVTCGGDSQDLGTATADDNGEFSFPATLATAGSCTLTATGQTSGVTVTAAVTVAAGGSDEADESDTTGLAVTGSAVARWATVGGAAVIVGAALLGFVYLRGRRQQPAGMPREHEPVA